MFRPTLRRAVLLSLAGIMAQAFLQGISAQEPSAGYGAILETAEKRYGPSGELLNGEKYHYPYHSIQGDPFLGMEGSAASIQISGTIYEGQSIRFDIFNHEVVLDYTDPSGAPGSIVLNGEWIDHFSLGGSLFRKYPDPEGEVRFAQVIYEGRISCICFWEKRITQNMYDSRQQSFSEPKRTRVILYGEEACSFSGRRSFLLCFDRDRRPGIKDLLKKHRIRMRKVSDWQLENLMVEIDRLIEP